MSEERAGYYVHQFPDGRPIITLEVLNMEIINLRHDIEALKQVILCQKQIAENQAVLIAELQKELQALDGWGIN